MKTINFHWNNDIPLDSVKRFFSLFRSFIPKKVREFILSSSSVIAPHIFNFYFFLLKVVIVMCITNSTIWTALYLWQNNDAIHFDALARKKFHGLSFEMCISRASVTTTTDTFANTLKIGLPVRMAFHMNAKFTFIALANGGVFFCIYHTIKLNSAKTH